MIVELQEGPQATSIDLQHWGIALHGEILDERGMSAVTEVQHRTQRTCQLRYFPETLEFEFDSERFNVDSFSEVLHTIANNSIVLEATTLGFVEILLCCRVLYKIGLKRLDIVYVEPERYSNPRRNHLLHRRDFELSGTVSGYLAIPGNAILLGDHISHKGVFLLGYEEARLRRAFEDLQMIHSSNTAVVVGVPAFKPGWEMDSIANNITVIREQNIRGGLNFCGAENPAAVMELLTKIYKGLGKNERLYIAPIGTKPHGVGTALFVSQHSNVGVIYDHPERKKGRSDKLGHWHLFTVQNYQPETS